MDPRRSVLLFSGGLDSLCAAFICKPDVLLYVPMGIAYQAQEQEAILAMQKWLPVESGVTMPPHTLLNLRSWERPVDRIVPNRNAVLVLVASMYGDVIQLASVRGDRSCDKDETFCHHMTELLNHTWQAQHWTVARTHTVCLPVKLYTKRQLLQRALHAGMPQQLVWDSWSCYDPHNTLAKSQPCGWCKPCVRKYVAMKTAMYWVPEETYLKYFYQDPRQAPWVQQTLRDVRANKGSWRGEEDIDFLTVMEGVGLTAETR